MANRLITVARAGYMHRAYFFKNWLDSAGIESVIYNQGINYALAGNEIELQVDQNNVLQALEILEMTRYEPEFKQIHQKITAIKNILVPVNFSPNSLNAAKYALHVANQKKASITFANAFYDKVINPINYETFYSYPGGLDGIRLEEEKESDEKMRNFLSILTNYMDIEGITDIKPRQILMAGSVEDVILSVLENGNFDLIIAGSGKTVALDSWFGTFISNIVDKSTIPLMTIPEDAVYKKSGLKELMYATNFDKSDGIAIRKLLNIFSPLQTRIHVVHIDDTGDNAFINYNMTHFKEKYIGKIDSPDMFFDLIVNESIIEGIENYIKQRKIDFLAVTTHKRNVITSFLRPSITKELLFEVDIPLLIFHSNP